MDGNRLVGVRSRRVFPLLSLQKKTTRNTLHDHQQADKWMPTAGSSPPKGNVYALF